MSCEFEFFKWKIPNQITGSTLSISSPDWIFWHKVKNFLIAKFIYNESSFVKMFQSWKSAYRKSKKDSECNPRIDSGMERSELWYMSNVSRNGNPVTSSGNSQSRFRDKSVINGEKHVKSYRNRMKIVNKIQRSRCEVEEDWAFVRSRRLSICS